MAVLSHLLRLWRSVGDLPVKKPNQCTHSAGSTSGQRCFIDITAPGCTIPPVELEYPLSDVRIIILLVGAEAGCALLRTYVCIVQCNQPPLRHGAWSFLIDQSAAATPDLWHLTRPINRAYLQEPPPSFLCKEYEYDLNKQLSAGHFGGVMPGWRPWPQQSALARLGSSMTPFPS